MVEYSFYTDEFRGNSIPREDWPRFAMAADAQLSDFKRKYTARITDEHSTQMAACAMADTLYFYAVAQSGGMNGGTVSSVGVGSVSTSYGSPMAVSTLDVSPKAQSRELYRAASMYLDFYRGVGG